MPYVQVDAEVWIEPEEFLHDLKDDELIEELKHRGYYIENLMKINEGEKPMYGDRCMLPTLNSLFEMKQRGDSRFDEAFAKYIYHNLGRVLV